MVQRVWRIRSAEHRHVYLSGEDGAVVIEILDPIRGRGLAAEVTTNEFVDAVAGLIRTDGILYETRPACEHEDRCEDYQVPSFIMITKILRAIAEFLNEAPAPVRHPADREAWVWKPEEQKAALEAARLLSKAIEILERAGEG